MVAELGLLTELTTVLRPPEGALEEEEEEDRPPSTESSSSKFLSAHDPEEAGREGKTNKQTHLVSRFHVTIHSESMCHHLSALIQLSGETYQSSSSPPAESQSLSLSLCVQPPLSAPDFLPGHRPPDVNAFWQPCADSQRHLPGVSAHSRD